MTNSAMGPTRSWTAVEQPGLEVADDSVDRDEQRRREPKARQRRRKLGHAVADQSEQLDEERDEREHDQQDRHDHEEQGQDADRPGRSCPRPAAIAEPPDERVGGRGDDEADEDRAGDDRQEDDRVADQRDDRDRDEHPPADGGEPNEPARDEDGRAVARSRGSCAASGAAVSSAIGPSLSSPPRTRRCVVVPPPGVGAPGGGADQSEAVRRSVTTRRGSGRGCRMHRRRSTRCRSRTPAR